MRYFAYGSNMSIARLRQRAPSAISLGYHLVKEHDLRFHKFGKDGSGKCNAFFTGNAEDVIYGVLFEIISDDKHVLDKVEGLGYGYDEKVVRVTAANGVDCEATTYVASNINKDLKPYSWYVNHVYIGAKESLLPDDYIKEKIIAVDSVEDREKNRDTNQRAIHI